MPMFAPSVVLAKLLAAAVVNNTFVVLPGTARVSVVPAASLVQLLGFPAPPAFQTPVLPPVSDPFQYAVAGAADPPVTTRFSAASLFTRFSVYVTPPIV